MKICIYGAGAIGGYLGVQLARAGADVSLVARGAHLPAMRANAPVSKHPLASVAPAVTCRLFFPSAISAASRHALSPRVVYDVGAASQNAMLS